MLSLLGIVNSWCMFLFIDVGCLVSTVLFLLMPVYMGNASYNSRLTPEF